MHWLVFSVKGQNTFSIRKGNDRRLSKGAVVC